MMARLVAYFRPSNRLGLSALKISSSSHSFRLNGSMFANVRKNYNTPVIKKQRKELNFLQYLPRRVRDFYMKTLLKLLKCTIGQSNRHVVLTLALLYDI
ncbi:unnamed protein product [Vicia faba]|uniref:Uncharacterized protein n=1 Tax=Vicia faba TaxID=3906 RepID=A0AAV0ZF09_VICFA|nr:unnamed protein product [Vicia faba]CAI8608493.1 unnamed protein product [Vicia faba]